MTSSLAAAAAAAAAAVVESNGGIGIRRWTLAALASQEPTPAVARLVLEDVATRLEQQTVACQELQQQITTTASSASPSLAPLPVSSRRMIQQQLEFLHYVHVDTARQCRFILQRDPIWQQEEKQQQSPSSTKTTREATGHDSGWSNPTHERIVRQCLEAVRDRHASSLERWVDIALALRPLPPPQEQNHAARISMEILDHVLQGRFSIQLLTHHYSLLASENIQKRRKTGAIAVNYCLADLVHDAYTEAHFLCQAHYQQAPDLDLSGVNDVLLVTVVRPWLTHVLVEVMKNAMSATIQQQQQQSRQKQSGQHKQLPPQFDDDDTTLQPLHVSAVETSDSVVLTVRDHGVGLLSSSSSFMQDPFGWGTSSARQRWDRLKEQQSYAAVRPPLASLGVGLPSSRAMLRHFGGDLVLLPASSSLLPSLQSSTMRNDTYSCNNSGNKGGGGCLAQITIPRNIHLPEHLPPHFLPVSMCTS